MTDATNVLRVIGIILLGIFVFAVGIPLVMAAAGITLGIIGILFSIAVLVIKLAVVIAIVYAGLGTLVILFVLNKFIPIRSSGEAEMKGLDSFYHGERGYGMINPS